MRIIIVGGGKLAHFLIESLSRKGHEIVLIEEQETVSQLLADDFDGVRVIHGDGTDIPVLHEANCYNADFYLAVTGKDENNLIGCQVAKQRFNVRNTVARVNNPRNKYIFETMGVDRIYSSTSILVSIIEQDIVHDGMRVAFDIEKSDTNIVEVVLHPESDAVGKTLIEYKFPGQTRVVLIIRQNGSSVIPMGDTKMIAGDILYLVCNRSEYDTIYAALVEV